MKFRLPIITLVMTLAMLAATVMGQTLKPRILLAEENAIHLTELVPERFGNWHMVPGSDQLVYDPATEEMLKSLYSQLLNRVYVNDRGESVMLAIAYGRDQRRGMVAHRPDVCYPSQGFTIGQTQAATVKTRFGDVPAERLFAHKGSRHEPVTFWFTLGDTTIHDKLQRRLVMLRYSLTGQIADGLLFRVSSLDSDADQGYRLQDRFIDELTEAMPPQGRRRLAGLKT
jgi:EpsI family protein